MHAALPQGGLGVQPQHLRGDPGSLHLLLRERQPSDSRQIHQVSGSCVLVVVGLFLLVVLWSWLFLLVLFVMCNVHQNVFVFNILFEVYRVSDISLTF